MGSYMFLSRLRNVFHAFAGVPGPRTNAPTFSEPLPLDFRHARLPWSLQEERPLDSPPTEELYRRGGGPRVRNLVTVLQSVSSSLLAARGSL